MNRFQVRKVAVLGAGVMGAQIAAHLVNVKVPVVLFDLAAKEGAEERHRAEGARRPEEAEAVADRRGRRPGADRGRQLRRAPRAAQAVRPGDRGDRRAHGLEARPVHEDRTAPGAARDRRVQHLGPVDHQAVAGAAGRDQAALLRHPLLQPAALHGAGGADPDADHVARDPRPARGLRHHRPGQGRGARQGHAELHRQPRRHRRHAGDHGRGREVRPRGRRGRRPHRQEDGPRQLGHLPHRRRGGPRHDGPRGQDDAGQPAGRPVLPALRHAQGAGRPDRQGRARPEDRRGLLQEGRQGHPAPGSGQGRLRARRPARPIRSSSACSRNPRANG